MSKYKLIKEYPGSPDIGYISKEKFSKDPSHYWGGSWFVPKDFPEFWREVIEEKYQIYKLKSTSYVSDMFLDGKIGWSVDNCPEYRDPLEILKSGRHEIYSVIRTSDKEVFTIGDKIDTGAQITMIDSFEYVKDSRDGAADGLWVVFKSGRTSLEYAKEIKLVKNKPLFISEDGVEMFDGDNYYHVILNGCYMAYNFPQRADNSTSSRYDKKYVLLFSSLEAAKKYVDINALRYSKKRCD